MEQIRLNSDGKLTRKGREISSPALKLLGNPIELSTDFTLSAFFRTLEIYPEFMEISDLSAPLLEIVKKAPSPEFKTDEIEELVFLKMIEIKGFPGPPALDIYNSLKGVLDNQIKDLKFFHIETLLGHRIRLGRLKHIVFGDKEDMFQYDTFYTLFELLEGITWDLSFNFNPLECSIRR